MLFFFVSHRVTHQPLFAIKSTMRFSITTIVSLVTASATLVSSASIMRPDGDNGSCAQLHRICAGQVQYDLNNVWAIESCLFAGICYERQSANLDHFLGAL